jgi:hypothetical protein
MRMTHYNVSRSEILVSKLLRHEANMTPRWFPVACLALLASTSCSSIPSVLLGEGGRSPMTVHSASDAVISVHPVEIDDVLYNPGMGFADFHFGAFSKPAVPEQYPRSTVAYFRWSWADLEPLEGQYNFDLVDQTIAQAKSRGETLAFRILSDYQAGPPRWLLAKGVASVPVGGGTFPDFNNPLFLDHHEKLIRAFGTRYAGSPDIDHVDIGSVGCWGEWNTACCQGVEKQCKQYYPTEKHQWRITDWYFQYFRSTPLVMVHGGQLKYAVSRGAGWRGDCFGDYGYFSPTWNHMEHAYAPALEDPVIAEAWKRGPVQLEVCGVMQDWFDKGFDIDLILKKGLEWHVSVLNGKSSPIPEPWRARVEAFQKKMGYRIVLREMTHRAESHRSGSLTFQSRWENVGVAPVYRSWPLAYRLRSGSGRTAAQWMSQTNVRQWLPEKTIEVQDTVVVPSDVQAGRYDLDVAILREDGQQAGLYLAIAGARADRWYPVSTVTIRE